MDEVCSEEEVSKALKEMKPCKAPGPDGFHAAFFQRTWDVTGLAVNVLAKQVMIGEGLPLGLEDVQLVLIPKTYHLTNLIQFCPISLCNVACKIITKLIANGLKGVWGDLIAPTQANFIPQRQSIDKVMIFQELLHLINQRKGRTGAMVIKLDL